MKKIAVYVLCLFVFTVFIAADIYIEEKTHTDSYYYGGVVHPENDYIVEIWFRDHQMAYMTAGRIVIVDQSKRLISIINRRDKTYVETSIPLDMKNILPQETLAMLQPRQVSGNVEETKEKKKISNWNCAGYDINVDRPYALEIKNWSTVDVPFNWEQLNEMFSPIRRLGNYSDSYIDQLKKIKGFVVHTDVKIFLQGTTFGSKSQVIEISRKDPPSGVYVIPDGFQKKNQLTIQDLRNR
ncbi:MAG: hypothetical protein KAT17_01095 [Candidatus Aminicenantes bacterium]|nr:hypothetical protein [Candidatus Aminicenantes bacterium]